MNPILMAMLGTFGYAYANVLMEQKFSKYNTLTIIIFISGVTFILANLTRVFIKKDDKSFIFPVGKEIIPFLFLGLIYFAADYFYVGAYSAKGKLMTITCVAILFPVFASLMKYYITDAVPNAWQVWGYLLATVAIMLVTKGSMAQGGA